MPNVLNFTTMPVMFLLGGYSTGVSGIGR